MSPAPSLPHCKGFLQSAKQTFFPLSSLLSHLSVLSPSHPSPPCNQAPMILPHAPRTAAVTSWSAAASSSIRAGFSCWVGSRPAHPPPAGHACDQSTSRRLGLQPPVLPSLPPTATAAPTLGTGWALPLGGGPGDRTERNTHPLRPHTRLCWLHLLQLLSCSVKSTAPIEGPVLAFWKETSCPSGMIRSLQLP